MNIQNVNNQPNAPGPATKNRGVADRRETEKTNGSDAPAPVINAGQSDAADVRPIGDTFQSTAERDFVASLTSQVEEMDTEPRQDRVEQVRARVNEGFYNSKDIVGNLALRLVNTERIA